MRTLTFLSFVISLHEVLSSRNVEVNNVYRLLTQNCPSILESTLEKLAEKVIDLYDQINQLWNVQFEGLPEDLMIWDIVFEHRPSLRKTVNRLSNEASDIFKDELVDAGCMVIGAFFTNVVRFGSRENYLLTRLFMEHSSWFKRDLSLLLQLKHRMRLIIMEDKHRIKLLNDLDMLQLEEFTLYGYRFALQSERNAYISLLGELSMSKHLITAPGTFEAQLYWTGLSECDKHKILACLRDQEDLITVKGISHVKRTSDFFPTFYWMSIYYKMTSQPGTRLFDFAAKTFIEDFSNFQKFFPLFKALAPKNPNQKMEIIVLFNVFSTFGRYLGIVENYLTLKRNIYVSLLNNKHEGFR